MAIVEISIVPIGTETTSVSHYVAQAVAILQRSGLRYELSPMGTIIEGDLRTIMQVILEMHESVFTQAARRVYTVIKIDDRRDITTNMEYKVRSVEQKLVR
ncbi:MAG: MTH1187 family thiamine-binding protein [Desulfobacterota bacterium]|nr:MTH1187 family thiamine-binding protein [Thermodesulfobacteriota bacterium]